MSEQFKSTSGTHQSDWWLGMTDAVTMGAAHTASVAERMHLAIADETFQVLSAVPVVNKVSQPVRAVHHGIARFCYQSVGFVSVGLNRLIQFSVKK